MSRKHANQAFILSSSILSAVVICSLPAERSEARVARPVSIPVIQLYPTASSPNHMAGHAASQTVNNSGMSGSEGPLQFHDNGTSTTDMWLTQPNPGKQNWIQFDFGRVCPLGQMWVWNYNQKDMNHAKSPVWKRGLKNVHIELSSDGKHWTEFKGSGYPFQLTPANGTANLAATNLNNPNHTPIDFGGLSARFVRIVPNAAPGDGNWGGIGGKDAVFGLGAVRFYRFSPLVTNQGIIPASAVAGSESSALTGAVNVTNNFGMNGTFEPTDLHDNRPDASDMWMTRANPGSKNWIEFDLGGTYPIGQMDVWNFNQGVARGANSTAWKRGLRNVRIYYSIDHTHWVELKTTGYPFQFAPANGLKPTAATNLNDGHHSPVDFGGVEARYVKIVPEQKPGDGNWGGKDGHEAVFGLSAVRFYATRGWAAEPDLAWSSLFSRYSGWTGADGIFSIPLDNQGNSSPDKSKTLFLFSDTYVGLVDPLSKIRTAASFVHNTLATLSGQSPSPTAIQFMWNQDKVGVPTSVFTPSTANAQAGTLPISTIDGAGMSGTPGSAEVHDNNATAADMWLSGTNQTSKPWIQYDFGNVYSLGRMWVWNFNQKDPSHPSVPFWNRGMKNVTIEYSLDGKTWTQLRGEGYPYQLAPADGSSLIAATNLNDEKHSPIQWNGVRARYVRIVPNPSPGDGNWGGKDGKEAAFGLSAVQFYTADGERLTFANATASSTWKSESKADWYWLQDGVTANHKVYIFPILMGTDPTGAPGFQFKVDGVSMISAPIVNGTVDLKHAQQVDTNLFYHPANHSGDIYFGAGIMANTADAGAPNPDGYLYIYGYRNAPDGVKQLVAARVLPQDVEKFNEWRFWDGIGWSPYLERVAPLMSGVSAELSVSPIKSGALKGKFVLIYEKNVMGNVIEASISDTPVGPFNKSVPLYYTSEPEAGNGIFTYNAKAHPYLSSPGELLVSYNVNSTDPSVLSSDADIYRPRWIKIRQIQ